MIFQRKSPHHFAGDWPRNSLAVALLTLLAVAGMLSLTIEDQHRPPDFDHFVGLYFKELFLLQIVVITAWFMAAIKPHPGRFQEYKWLSSLPFSADKTFNRFLLADIIRFSWAPAAISVFYILLLPLSSATFLSRPVLWAFLTYLPTCTLIALFHLFFAGNKNAHDYLQKYNPIIPGLLFPGYLIINVVFVVTSEKTSSLAFLFIAGAVLGVTALIYWLSKKRFHNLQNQSFWLKTCTKNLYKTETPTPWIVRILNRWVPSLKNEPLLRKNILQSSRSASAVTQTFLTLVFLSLAYLMAMNNQAISDAVSVLLVILTIYFILYGFTTLNQFLPEVESPLVVYALPVTRMQFYLSVYLPAVSRLLLLNTCISIWLALKTVPISLVSGFWLESCLAVFMWITLSVNVGIANYPHVKQAKKQLTHWNLAIIVLGAIFYKYRLAVALLLLLLSFLPLRKLNLNGPILFKTRSLPT